MGFLGWIVVGALAGWIGSMITGNNKRMGLLANIVIGVIGGFVGGFVVNLIGGQGITGFNLWSIIVAILGSVILLTIINLFKRSRR